MCKHCAKEIAACLQDETCRRALECLNSCQGNDQVCSYRCIVSHETPAFENFARCILQVPHLPPSLPERQARQGVDWLAPVLLLG
jgi:hypothetical protein